MDGFFFGKGFEIVLISLALLQTALRIVLEVAAVYYLTKVLTPKTVHLWGVKDKLTRNGIYDFLAYQITWFFVGTLLAGTVESFWRKVYLLGQLEESLFPSYLNFYLLGLTIWSYNESLSFFKLKPLPVIFLYALSFLVLGFLLNLVSFSFFRTEQNISYFWGLTISPFMYGILTLFLVSKNKLST